MIKRVVEFLIVILALPLLLPVMLAVAVVVRIRLGSPIIFRQLRAGKDGQLFWIWKFRTMSDDRDEHGELLPDAERLKPFGKLLRSTSLDELPSLINFLRGDLALVGPRPLLREYLPLYSPEQARRHVVRPGITGWAQVMGRNSLSWEERLRLDVWYVDNRTLWLDIRILFLTLIKVVAREGIQGEGNVTMDRFTGSR